MEKEKEPKEPSFNKKLTEVKLLLSSLFARKQQYVVFNFTRPNILYFTSIPAERAEFYSSDVDDTLSRVVLTEKAAKLVYEFYPFLKQMKGIVDLTDMLQATNKWLAVHKGEMPSVTCNSNTGEILIDTVPTVTTGELLFGEKKNQDSRVVIGKTINDLTFMKYQAILDHYHSFTKEPIELEVTVPAAYYNDDVVLNKVEIVNNRYNAKVFLNLPMQDGVNAVSFKEYLAKRKLPWKYKIDVRYNEAKSVAHVSFMHKDDYVDVVTTCPGTLWFPFRKV